MLRTTLAATAVAVMAGSAMAADYFFPTAYPQGVNLDTVKQIVTFIWDDNAYSGLEKTDYELHPDSTHLFLEQGKPNSAFGNHNWVGGKKPWSATEVEGINQLNLQEGDFGMAWAISKLAGITLSPAEWKPGLYITGDKVLKDGKVYVARKRIEGSTTTFNAIDPDTIAIEDTKWEGGQEVKVTLTWDDLYDPTTGTIDWRVPDSDWYSVGPFVPEQHPESNYNSNPDGSQIQFTFNVISGLFVPIAGAQDGNRVSKYGWWRPNEVDVVEFPHLDIDLYKQGKLPIAWGREMPVIAKLGDTENVNGEAYGRINDVFKLTKSLGHEIGNHTIDHLESNSMLPQKEGAFPTGTYGEWTHPGFSAWGGAGFAADEISEKTWLPGNETASEVEEFGRQKGITWHYMGWELYAGKTLPVEAWKGLIELGEEDLDVALGLKPLRETGGTVGSFRAPRLEVNSGLHYALKELGYEYDCGQEEGYEYHIDGKNFYWPYTTDNGSPNVSWQRSIGETMTIDSMPSGLWQIPVNAMIVPTEIRESVWNNYAIIAEAEGEVITEDDKTHWIQNSGRVTGFDFNMFILWGMTKENALKTLQYNLDQRMLGGKAPMQVGCHTDYFTPIYDHATLLEETNRSTYGLVVDRGWNTWTDRQETFEEFIEYGLGKGAYFWSGKQTIDYVRKIAAEDKVGSAVSYSPTWTFMKNENLGSTAPTESFSGDFTGEITVAAGTDDQTPSAGFITDVSSLDLSGLDHISLDYKTDIPLAIKLHMGNDKSWEVWLNNLNTNVSSGNIPLSAFHYNQYDKGDKSLDASDIIAIGVHPITNPEAQTTAKFTVNNLKIYTGGETAIKLNSGIAKEGIALKGISQNALQLNIPEAGVYTVELITLDGRIVKSLTNRDMKAGINPIDVNSVANGLYLLNIKSDKFRKTLKATIL